MILVYVDDLILTWNDLVAIDFPKSFLDSHFHMKDTGCLKYFLGVEVDHCKEGIFLSHRERINSLDILKEFDITRCKTLKLPMESHVELRAQFGTPLSTPGVYQRLVGKLTDLTLTRLVISFIVQFLNSCITLLLCTSNLLREC